ncbi:MAG: DUF3800 domain-containing protein [Candidatus Omnitrophota bacterium]
MNDSKKGNSVLFLDESGDHDLIMIDPEYPIFVLAGCIIDFQYEEKVLTATLNKFKEDFFGNKEIVLHLAEYTRDGKGYEKLRDKDLRGEFYAGLNKIIKDAEFDLVACIIDKNEHIKHYKNAIDPYLLSLEVIVERFVMFLKEKKAKGVIIAESRGQQLDNQLSLAFLDLKISGTRFLRPIDIAESITDFRIRKKDENIPGLQLVDSVITPIGRRYLNKRNFYIAYDVIKSKFRKHSCGKYRGYGLIILPKKQIGQPPHPQ